MTVSILYFLRCHVARLLRLYAIDRDTKYFEASNTIPKWMILLVSLNQPQRVTGAKQERMQTGGGDIGLTVWRSCVAAAGTLSPLTTLMSCSNGKRTLTLMSSFFSFTVEKERNVLITASISTTFLLFEVGILAIN